MSMIAQNTDECKVVGTISTFMHRFQIGMLLAKCNAYKEKGISVVSIFTFMLRMVFADRSMFQQMRTGRWAESFGKNTYYRFLNSAKINWERFLTLLSKQVIETFFRPLTNDDRKDVFIIDDSLYERAGYKKTQLCARVFDHTKMRYCKGFRLLTLLWSDGNSSVPVGQRLLSSTNKDQVLGAKPVVDGRTISGKRHHQARRKGTTVMIELLKAAIKAGHHARYVLFDSWFSAPKQLKDVKDLGLNVIAMIKRNGKIHYRYNGECLDIRQIYSRNKKRRGRSKYLLSVTVDVESDGVSFPAKIVCVRNRANRKDWLAIISTDTDLSEEEVIRLYGKRWDIEVFFKVCKTYLKLTTECHSLSYDALTAHTVVVFTRYILLSVQQRGEVDDRSLGDLFLAMIDELEDISFAHSFELIMSVLLECVRELFKASDADLSRLSEALIDKLPAPMRDRLLKNSISCA